MDLSRRQFLAVGGAVVLAAKQGRRAPKPPPPPPSSGWFLSAEPGLLAPGAFYVGAAA